MNNQRTGTVSRQWTEATKSNPCPICNKPDWCFISHDLSAVICGRVTPGSQPSHWFYHSDTSDGRALYRDHDKSVNTNKPGEIIEPYTIPENTSLLARKPHDIGLCDRELAATSTQDGNRTFTVYNYSKTQRVKRIDFVNGEKKQIYQQHLNSCRDWENGKGEDEWPPYRLGDVEHWGKNHWIILVEGEKCVEAVASMGLVATTFQGSNWGAESLTQSCTALKGTGIAGIVIIPDNDQVGLKKSQDVARVCNELQLSYTILNLAQLGIDLPDRGDIVDVYSMATQQVHNMTVTDFIQRLELEIHQSLKTKENQAKLALGATPLEVYGKPIKGNTKQWTQEVASDSIAEILKDMWIYHVEQSIWRVWNGKYWEAQHPKVFSQRLEKTLKAASIPYDTESKLNGIGRLLELKLGEKKWKTLDSMRYIPFSNGVLDLETYELIPHAREQRLTYIIPYTYSILENIHSNPLDALKEQCPATFSYFYQAMGGDTLKMLKMLAVCNGIIKRVFSQYEMFVHCYGVPSSGKSTFMRLLVEMVGRENHAAARLGKLNDDNQIAGIINKQLVTCGDEDSVNGGLSGLKRLTGRDGVSYRAVYKEAAHATFYGTLVIGSNQPLFSGETRGIHRRYCGLEFNNAIAAANRNPKLDEKLFTEIPRLIPIALSLGDHAVKDILLGVGEYQIVDFVVSQWEQSVSSSSVADWANENVVRDPEHMARIGNKDSGVTFLYRSYVDYCSSVSRPPLALNNFSEKLIQVLQELGWSVEKRRHSLGVVIKGVRLRDTLDTAPIISETLSIKEIPPLEPTQPTQPLSDNGLRPTLEPTLGLHSEETAYIEESILKENIENEPTLCRPSVDLDVDLKPLQDKASVDHVDLKQNFYTRVLFPLGKVTPKEGDDVVFESKGRELIGCVYEIDEWERITLMDENGVLHQYFHADDWGFSVFPKKQ